MPDTLLTPVASHLPAPVPLLRLIAARLAQCSGYQMSDEFTALLSREPLLLAALQRLALTTVVIDKDAPGMRGAS